MPASDQSKPVMDQARRKQLRAIGHALKPVVTIGGEGLSAGVMAEVHRALDDHELIKVRITVGERKLKEALITQLCEQSGSVLVQAIGNIALVLRESKKPKKRLSNLKRNPSKK